MKKIPAVFVVLLLMVVGLFFFGSCGGASSSSAAVDDDASPTDDDSSLADDDDNDNDDAAPPADPGQPGPHSIGDMQMTFHDPSSNKDQPLHFFYPSADSGKTIDAAAGPRPLIIFGPGFSLPMNIYFDYGRHLATHGYVVAFRNNYVVSHLGLAQSTAAIIDWITAQEAQSGTLFHGKLDLTRIGTSGHSMGGKISLLSAYYDKRITASATIDPVDASPLPGPQYPSVTPELMPDIHIPTLMVGGSDGGACAPAAQNYHQYWLYANAPSVEIEILKSGHITFCDLPDSLINAAAIICPTGGGNFERIRYLASRYVTAFYKVHFDGEAGYEYYLTGAGIAKDVADGLVKTEAK